MCRGAKRSAVWATVLAVLAAGGCALADAQAPFILTVQPHHNLQHAIEMAPEGAVVHLAAGTWETHLDISKSLTLRGSEDGSTIRGHEEDIPVIRVHAGAEVFLEQLRVTGGRGRSGHGILVEGTSKATIHGCAIVDNSEAGVSLRDSAQVAIKECVISRNVFGIYVWDSGQMTVSATSISESTSDGVVLGNTSHGTVTHSDVSENGRFGIWLWSFSQVSVSGSTIAGNDRPGIWVGWMDGDAPHASISDSTLVDNGITISASASATVVGSSIVGRLDGITLKGSARVTIERNWIGDASRYGVMLWERPCFDTDDVFTGYIAGFGNTIPGPGEANGNRQGAVCPNDLAFLMTEEGGELDRREE